MSSSLETKFTGDSSQLEAAYQKIAKENVKLRDEMKKTADEHRAGGEHANSIAEKMTEHLGAQAGKLVEIAAEWVGIHKAIELASEAQEHYGEMQKQALEEMTKAGNARPQLDRNLAGLSASERAEVNERLEKLAGANGIDSPNTLMPAAVAAVSSTAGDIEKAFANLEAAIKMVPDAAQHPEALAGLSAGIGGMEKVTGEQDAIKNLGLLLAMQKGAQVYDVENAQHYLLPAAMGLKQHGATTAESFAFLQSLTQATMDPTGELSGTGAIRFAQKLDEFFDPEHIESRVKSQIRSESGAEARGDAIDQALRKRVTAYAGAHGIAGAGSYEFKELMQQIGDQNLMRGLVESETARITGLAGQHEFGKQVEVLRSNEELRKQFAQTHPFGRADTDPALRAFLETPQSVMGQFYDREKLQLPEGEAQRLVAQQAVQNLENDPNIAAVKAQNAIKLFAEREGQAHPQDAARAIYKDAFADLLKQRNRGPLAGIGNAIQNTYMSVGDWMGFENPQAAFTDRARHDLFQARYRESLDQVSHRDFLDPVAAERAGRLHRRTDEASVAETDRIETLLIGVTEELKKLNAKADAQHEQAGHHHRENQSTARQNGARIQGAQPRGRE